MNLEALVDTFIWNHFCRINKKFMEHEFLKTYSCHRTFKKMVIQNVINN